MNEIEKLLSEGWMKALRIGTFRDSRGRLVTYTRHRLKKLAENYDPGQMEAPLFIGHEYKDSTPAKGWIQDVKAIGGFLFVKVKELGQDMIEKLKNKEYKYVSIAASKDDHLEHLAFVPFPAVPGLGPINPKVYAQFSKDNENSILLSFEAAELEKDTLELALDEAAVQSKLKSIGDLWQRLYEFMINLVGLDDAKEAIPPHLVEYIKEYPVTSNDQANNFSKNNSGDKSPDKEETLSKEKDVTKNPPETGGNDPGYDKVEMSLFLKEADRANQEKARADAVEARLAEIEQEAHEKDVHDFSERLCKEGILIPKKKPLVEAFMMQLHQKDTLQFSSGTENISLPMSEAFKQIMEGMQPVVPLIPLSDLKKKGGKGPADDKIEFAAGEVTDEDLELDEKARAIMKEEKCDYETALREAGGEV
jgi:hypothetical protein